jgi:hypothetical protein
VLALCGGGIFAVYSVINAAQDSVQRTLDNPPSPTLTPSGPPATPGTPTAAVGAPLRMVDLEFTVTSKPTCATGSLGSGFDSATPKEGQFCQVPIKVVNRSTVDQRWICASLTLTTDRQDSVYYSLLGSRAVNKRTCIVDPKAGATWTGTVVFDVPTGSVPKKATFQEKIGGGYGVVEF